MHPTLHGHIRLDDPNDSELEALTAELLREHAKTAARPVT